MSAGSTGTNSSGETASFFQWLKVMSTFQEASDEIRGQLAAQGKCPLLHSDSAFYGTTLCTNPFLCQHWVPEAPAEGTDGVGAVTQHGTLSEAGNMRCRSRLFLIGDPRLVILSPSLLPSAPPLSSFVT